MSKVPTRAVFLTDVAVLSDRVACHSSWLVADHGAAGQDRELGVLGLVVRD